MWRNSVERQREAVELAKRQESDASIKAKAALDAMLKTGAEVELPRGKDRTPLRSRDISNVGGSHGSSARQR